VPHWLERSGILDQLQPFSAFRSPTILPTPAGADPRSERILGIMEVQLRDYRIKPGQMDVWIARWKSGVVPVRQEFGFEILSAWVDREHDRFVWLIGYSGIDGFDAANSRYYASERRTSLRPEPSELIEEASKVMVDPVT
jgi:hypothetical protein